MEKIIRQYIKEERYDEALMLLNKKLEEQPDNDEVYYLRGLLYKQLGKWGESLSDLNKAIALNPNSPAVTLRRLLQDIVNFRNNDLLNP